MPWLFLLVSLWGAWFTYNAYRPASAGPGRAFLSFGAAWLTGELALHHVLWQAIFTAGFVWAGALSAWPGQLGLGITLLSWVALGHLYWRARDTAPVIEAALRDGLGSAYASEILPEWRAKFSRSLDWWRILRPFPIRRPDVERVRDIPFVRIGGLNLRLDVYRHASQPTGCPTLLQVHGGAWITGSKNVQALPLMYHLASRGWVCVSINYRLSPHATFPEHLIDVKSALKWIREHGAEYGADPDYVVVTGGSAGAHLSALAALTVNDPEYQPGFEDVDTSVRACVPFYGVYDLTDRHGVWPHEGLRRLTERQVMKASIEEAPELYDKASPVSRIHAASPPFLVIHGASDSLAPVEEARRFVQAFREGARAPVVYAEIPGAQHAFELFPSLRTLLVIDGVERFLAHRYSQYLKERPATRRVASARRRSGGSSAPRRSAS